jgi:hypothetical protein
VPFDLHDGDLQGVEDLTDEPQLLTELVGRLPAPRLVLGVLLEADRRLALVEGHRQEVRLLLLQQLDEHRREPVHGVRHLAARGDQRGGQGEECPIGKAVSVEEEDPLGRLAGAVGGWIGGHLRRL